MTAFTPKKLPLEETVGEKLRQARHYKNLKIEDVAKRLNIRKEYLSALEEEDFDRLPTGLYSKKFLKEYASFLGLRTNDLLKNWRLSSEGGYPADPFSQKVVKKNKFIIFPRIIRNILIAAAVLICFLYLTFYFKKIIFPPTLNIIEPEKNMLTTKDSILIKGETEPGAEIKINGEIVLNNDNGNFSQSINLKKGLNNIVITAKKKYSREKIVNRQILVE
ncbi:MAG: helix-turn-helix domain-containing protein [Patescibacteria group bacterium]